MVTLFPPLYFFAAHAAQVSTYGAGSMRLNDTAWCGVRLPQKLHAKGTGGRRSGAHAVSGEAMHTVWSEGAVRGGGGAHGCSASTDGYPL